MKDFMGTKGNWSIGNGGHCIVSTEKPKRRGYGMGEGLETETVLEIDESEIKILQSVLKQSVSRLRRQYEKYLDIRDGGEATDRQTDKLFEYEEKLQVIERFLKL